MLDGTFRGMYDSSMITIDYLRAAIDYNQSTGAFVWRVSTSNVKAGTVAGCVNAKGYQYIGIGGKLYRANRLAWFYVHGTWPNGQIDHINGNRLDNRIENLRDVDGYTNQRNRHNGNKGSSSKLCGVSFHKGTGKWRAQLSINKTTKHLGLFDSEVAAHNAYKTAKTEALN